MIQKPSLEEVRTQLQQLTRGLLEVKPLTTHTSYNALTLLPPSLTRATTEFLANHHYSVAGLILLP